MFFYDLSEVYSLIEVVRNCLVFPLTLKGRGGQAIGIDGKGITRYIILP
jgi:hypothetical protein